MLKSVQIPIAEIYVPTKHLKTLEPEKAETIAESILEEGQRTPIQVRRAKERYVLLTGMHRLEAMKALGEESIDALIVGVRRS
jgi:ParB-like chromosome segregation protein Spo0J